MRAFVLLVCLTGLVGCASRSSKSPAQDAPHVAWGQTVADSAQWHLDHHPRLAHNDCSGLVQSVLARVGVPVSGGSRHLWARAKADGRIVKTAQPGDLAFFDYTYDKNRNGKVDDRLTHVAVVVRVDDDGTIQMVHRGSKGIVPLRMNTHHPAQHLVAGKVVNDYLRKRGYGAKNAPRLTGQLLRGFARPPRPPAHAQR